MCNYDLIVDAIFGFSFSGEPRSPFDALISMINNSKKEVVSIDVPSGTNIDKGAKDVKLCVESEMNISLMLPKEGLRNYTKKHFLGGRFLPAYVIILFYIIFFSYIIIFNHFIFILTFFCIFSIFRSIIKKYNLDVPHFEGYNSYTQL
ncbi:pyridoxal 5'-phosphate synthase [Plasmodium yoelii yoelii]|uniref:NAD(P)H-hydrate epimerase n=1 Tax=Plasmodium yoelii yoelii TaxID=73239 RepID=A0AAE9X134_PLAYO|nr:pyridoxal 5'-phosphate synthase [Plasmodium yoelii yoelii]